MRKTRNLLLSMGLIVVLVTFAAAAPNGPAEIKYSVKMGTVTFNHTAHQQVGDCATCHHTGDYSQCKSCHGVDDNAPKAKDAYHNLCKNCHKERNQGPTKCKECHIK